MTNGEPEGTHELRVFLCHASDDKPAVRLLYSRLRANGFEPWIDEENLLPGQDWQREIPIVVRNSDVAIVCLSKSSINKAGYIQKEINVALDVAEEQPEGTIFIIPIKLEACDIPPRLQHIHCVNLYEEHNFERLIKALNYCASMRGAKQEGAASQELKGVFPQEALVSPSEPPSRLQQPPLTTEIEKEGTKQKTSRPHKTENPASLALFEESILPSLTSLEVCVCAAFDYNLRKKGDWFRERYGGLPQEQQGAITPEARKQAFERYKKLEWEAVIRQHAEQVKLASAQLKASISAEENKRILGDHLLKSPPPGVLVAYENLFGAVEPLPLLILVSPPDVTINEHYGLTGDSRSLEESLLEGLRKLQSDYTQEARPINFIGTAWGNKGLRGEDAVQRLHQAYKSVPTLVLESECDGELYTLRVVFWWFGQESPIHMAVLSGLAVKQFFSGAGIKEGDSLPPVQQLTNLNWLLGTCHYLIAAVIADAYFFINYRRPPLLPVLLPTLLSGVNESKGAQEVIEVITAVYGRIYGAVEAYLPHWMPELHLQLAASFSHIPNKLFAREHLNNSVNAMLKLRVGPHLGGNRLEQLKAAFVVGDQHYVEAVRDFATVVEDEALYHDVAAVLKQWRELKISGRLTHDAKGDTLYDKWI
jgi:hypothetical protein